MNLIRYYSEKNDAGFCKEAYKIARDFEIAGDKQLSDYIVSLLSKTNKSISEPIKDGINYFEKIGGQGEPLWLPDSLVQELIEIVRKVQNHSCGNKFLFYGVAGTGKTETAKEVARILNRDIYRVNIPKIISNNTGQIQENFSKLFEEINNFIQPRKILLLFDSIDELLPTLVENLDRVNNNVVMIITTNKFQYLDKISLEEFDLMVNFDCYEESDLMEIAEKMLDKYLNETKIKNRNLQLFHKIMQLSDKKFYPGDLKSLIKKAVVFNNVNGEAEYLKRLYYEVCGEKPEDLRKLKVEGFTKKEREILTEKIK